MFKQLFLGLQYPRKSTNIIIWHASVRPAYGNRSEVLAYITAWSSEGPDWLEMIELVQLYLH